VKASFYRTSNGAEIDLILEFSERERWAIEVKRSLAPVPAKGFLYACEDVKPSRRFVLYPGTERYRMSGKAEAIPLGQLLAEC
jgi:hypothetical protein